MTTSDRFPLDRTWLLCACLVLLPSCASEKFWESKTPGAWAAELEHADGERRLRACRALTRMGRRASSAIHLVLETLKNPDPEVRSLAARVLDSIGPEDGRVLEAVDEMASEAGAAVPALAALLKTDDQRLRFRVILALRKLGPAAESAVPALGEALETSRWEAGLQILLSLEEMGPAAKKATPALIRALSHDRWSIRATASKILIAITPDERVAIGYIRRALEDDHAGVRLGGIRGLKKLGAKAKTAIPLLEKVAAKDDDARVRAKALGALTEIRVACRPAPSRDEMEERVAWLRDHAVPVRTIDPEDGDFSDLTPLAGLFGKARIVQLGEQSHGDGATFLAKARLIRFLHETSGFDLLAWESGLYDCRRLEEALRSEVPIDEAVQEGVFRIWTASGHVRPAFAYARATHETEKPLEIAGFDCQFSTARGRAGYPGFVRTFFEKAGVEISKASYWGDFEELCERLGEPAYDPGRSEREDFRTAVTSLLTLLETELGRLEKAHDGREVGFVRRTLKNLLLFEESRRRSFARDPEANNVRDKGMAETLIWLADEYYPGRKLVAWGASFHFMRNAPTIRPQRPGLSYEHTVPMGETVHRAFKEEAYTIMFTAHHGAWGNPFFGGRTLKPAVRGSLEDLLHEAGFKYAFVDFRSLPDDHWLRGKLLARPLGYTWMEADWTKVFDGLFFTDAMFPSRRDGRVPTGEESGD
ncbi:MAG: erythromycin esterase family protein [Planctomycetota bacterium]|jgi:erythromycin esterase